MGPSSSPHKLFTFRGIVHRTEALFLRQNSSATVKKYGSMVDVMKRAKFAVIEATDDYSDSNCVQCGSVDRPDELLLCDKCDKGFHITCVRPVVVRIPIGPWFCSDCSAHPRVISFSQRKIVEFFKIKKCGDASRKCSSPSPSLQDAKKRRRRSIIMKKKRRRLLPFIPVDDQGRRLEQMCSLASALTAHQMEFNNELTYCHGMAPRSANRADFEDGGMQILSKEDNETLEQCVTMFRQGQFPPLLIVYDSVEGYTVEADSNIKDMTFLAEYAGDVDYIRNRERDDCDSMMTLLLAKDPLDSLVICPDKRGNIARFVSGINNHTPQGKKKQNVKCVRYNVNGECRVLLVATRDIAKGERLYYDYNGYVHEYPTQHFV